MSFVMHVMSIELTALLFYFRSQVFHYYLQVSYMEFPKKWMLTTNKHLLKLALSDFSVMVKLCF